MAPAPAPKVDQATLIQRILAILQPQIGSAVSSAIEVAVFGLIHSGKP